MHSHDDIMRIHEELGISLIVVARLYRRELDNALTRHGLSEANSLPLRLLARAGKPLKQKELATSLDIESPSLVKVLTLLEERGLVIRHSLEGDKRVRLVSLSEKGQALNDELHRDLLYIRLNLFKGMDESDLSNFINLLSTVDHNLRNIER